MVHYEKHCAEPWISHIASGMKRVEGRLKKSTFAQMQPGDTVTWFDGEKRVNTVITGFREYPNFKAYLEAEGVDKVLPGVEGLENGLAVYYGYFSEEDRAKYPVYAILVELI